MDPRQSLLPLSLFFPLSSQMSSCRFPYGQLEVDSLAVHCVLWALAQMFYQSVVNSVKIATMWLVGVSRKFADSQLFAAIVSPLQELLIFSSLKASWLLQWWCHNDLISRYTSVDIKNVIWCILSFILQLIYFINLIHFIFYLHFLPGRSKVEILID